MKAVPRVLLADDHEDAIDVYEQFLTFHGLAVEAARNGEEALAKARALRPDVIVLDLAMPRLDGWNACRQLKADEDTRAIPVIVLTAHAYKAIEVSARDAGCDLFLTKPLLPERLLEEVMKVLEAARPAAP